MRRSELWVGAGGVSYATKPRPVLIVQDDAFLERQSVTVCLVTSDDEDWPDIRVRLPAISSTGLLKPSYVMIDKLMTFNRTNLSRRIGQVSAERMAEVERRLLVFLGLASRR